MTLTVTDMFCGAGGSSLGATFNDGVELKLALNHWPVAIETHNTNFPDAGHDCADVSQVNPRRYGSTDILLASPECTNHSLAKGAKRRKTPSAQGSMWEDGPAGDAEQEKSRATMWDVLRFAEVHRYRAIVVENVVDAYKWGPDDDGTWFAQWRQMICSLGYEHEIVYLNSMFTGLVPQSRDRMYVVFWQKGVRRPNLKLTPPAWCPACEKVVAAKQMFKTTGKFPGWGRYGAQYLYHCPDCLGTAYPGALPASTAIDWTLPATRIGDRARPLAKNTRARIGRGLERLAREPFAVRLLQGGNPRPTTLPLVTLTARHDMGVVLPVAGNTYETTPGNRARRADTQPFPTVHGTAEQGLVVPAGGTWRNDASRASEPMPTMTSRFEPSLVMNSSHGGGVVDPTTEAMSTLTTCEDRSLVYVDRANVVPKVAESEPTATLCAGANHLGVVVSNYGTSNPKLPASHGGWARDAALHPIGTVTATDGHALVVPYYSTGECADAERTPTPTLTTVDRVGLAWGDEDIDNCLFRMFALDEIARTMAMHRHTDGSEYVVTGNKRERMAQYGNGVTPPAMQFLVSRLQEVLAA